ncbi:MAG: PAS domain-containing protein, partial [Proteobacteria bacterium]|nr:PAS domain-containing protein [Pseudomonadota bacterium]
MKDASKLTLIKNESRQDSEGIQDIFENVPESISRIDYQGNYLSVNDNYAKTCGYKSGEMVGMSWKETVHKDDVAAAEQA